jgi:hypothetical protein
MNFPPFTGIAKVLFSAVDSEPVNYFYYWLQPFTIGNNVQFLALAPNLYRELL